MTAIIERSDWPKEMWPKEPFLAYLRGKGWCVCRPSEYQTETIMGHVRPGAAQVCVLDVFAIAELPPIPRRAA